MKKVEAIVRKTKFREVKKALIASGVDNFSYWLVRNVGEASEPRVYRGVEYEPSANERICVTFVIKENQLNVLELFTDSGITGDAGGSMLAIYDVKDVYTLVTKDGKDKAVRKM